MTAKNRKRQKKVMNKIYDADFASTIMSDACNFEIISALYKMSKLKLDDEQSMKSRYNVEGNYYPVLEIHQNQDLNLEIKRFLYGIHGEDVELSETEYHERHTIYKDPDKNFWEINEEEDGIKASTHVHNSLLWIVQYCDDFLAYTSIGEETYTFNKAIIEISSDIIYNEDALFDFWSYFTERVEFLYGRRKPENWIFKKTPDKWNPIQNEKEFIEFLTDIFGSCPSWAPNEYKEKKFDCSEHHAEDKSHSNRAKIKLVMPMSVERQEAFGNDLLNMFNSRTLANGSTKPPFKFVRDIDKKYGNHIQLIATEMTKMIWSDISSYSFDLKDAVYCAAGLTKRSNDVDYVLVTNVTAPSYEYVSHLAETGELTKEALEKFGGCWTNRMTSSDTISVYTADYKTIDKSKDECAGFIPVIDIYYGTFDELRLIKLPPINVVDIAICNALNRFANGVYWRPMYDNTSSDNGTSCRRYYPSKPLSVSSGNVKTTPADLENGLAAADELVEMSEKILNDPDNGYIRDIEQADIEVVQISMLLPKFHDVLCAIDCSLDPRVIDTHNGIWTGDSLTEKSRTFISKNMKRCYRPLDKTAGFLPFVSVTWKYKD